jgi:hypothetical protein
MQPGHRPAGAHDQQILGLVSESGEGRAGIATDHYALNRYIPWYATKGIVERTTKPFPRCPLPHDQQRRTRSPAIREFAADRCPGQHGDQRRV